MTTTPAVRVLHARQRQRKTGCRESREDVAASLGNSGSPSQGAGRTQHVSAGMLPERSIASIARCEEHHRRTVGARRAERGVSTAASLPPHRFDACIQQPAKVDKYQFARFDNVSDSVPRTVAFQTVTVKGDVDRIDIVHELQVVATHVRSYESGAQVLDPLQATESADRSGRNKDEGGSRSGDVKSTPGRLGSLERRPRLETPGGVRRTASTAGKSARQPRRSPAVRARAGTAAAASHCSGGTGDRTTAWPRRRGR